MAGLEVVGSRMPGNEHSSLAPLLEGSAPSLAITWTRVNGFLSITSAVATR